MRWPLALIVLSLATAVRAAEIDWQLATAPDVVHIVTLDADGDVRDTKVWIAFEAGTGWLRTGNSRWFDNLRRDPNARLRTGAEELEVRAELVEDPQACARVDAAMRAKYGWVDRMLGPFRWRASHVLRLTARTP